MYWDPADGQQVGRTFDFLLLVEVIDLIPDERLPVFLTNLDQHITGSVLLTSRSENILNTISQFTSWQIDAEASRELRALAELDWLQETIFFFQKPMQQGFASDGFNAPATAPQQQPYILFKQNFDFFKNKH